MFSRLWLLAASVNVSVSEENVLYIDIYTDTKYSVTVKNPKLELVLNNQNNKSL